MKKTHEILTKLKGRQITINRGENYITIEDLVKIVQEEAMEEIIRDLKDVDYRLIRLEEAWYKKQQYDVDEIVRLNRQYKKMEECFNMGFMDVIRHKLQKWLNIS